MPDLIIYLSHYFSLPKLELLFGNVSLNFYI